MAQTTMYAGMTNSPKTSLPDDITANDNSITLTDSSVLPDAPNLAVIGTSSEAEVIIYSGMSGNRLTGVLRGQGGTVAKAWVAGTAVARNFTIIDYDNICNNIRDLEARKRNAADSIDLDTAVSGTLPVSKGGTGKTDVAGIKTLLGLAAMAFKAIVNLASDVSGTLPIANGGTGLTASPSVLINLASTAAANILAASPRPGVTGTLPVGNGGTGQTTLAAARNAMGLGNTTGALPVANGGTGQTTLAAARNAMGLGNTTGVLPVANGGTGLSASPSMLTNLGSTTAANVMAASPRPGVTGTLPVGNGGTGQTSLQALRNAMGLGDTTGVMPIANGGTGANAAAGARTNLGITGIAVKPDYAISTTDLTAGSSALTTNQLYFVYE